MYNFIWFYIDLLIVLFLFSGGMFGIMYLWWLYLEQRYSVLYQLIEIHYYKNRYEEFIRNGDKLMLEECERQLHQGRIFMVDSFIKPRYIVYKKHHLNYLKQHIENVNNNHFRDR